MAEGETFKATVIGQLDGGTAIVFDFGYVDLTSGTGQVDTVTACGDFQTLVQDKLANVLPEGFTFMKYRFACVGGTHKGQIGYLPVSPPVVGNCTTEGSLPAEIAISLQRSTGWSSRKDRGRIFLGPVSPELFSGTHTDKPNRTYSALLQARDLLKANLTTQTRVLHPVILAADGTYTGRTVVNVNIGEVYVHRKSRRARIGA